MYVKANTGFRRKAFPGESAFKLRIAYSNKESEAASVPGRFRTSQHTRRCAPITPHNHTRTVHGSETGLDFDVTSPGGVYILLLPVRRVRTVEGLMHRGPGYSPRRTLDGSLS